MQQEYWIGIRREDKSVWERRAPLSPAHLKEVLEKHKDIHFIVQPSKKRIFSDYEYEKAGAILSEDLSKCTLILGIKEVPIHNLMPDKTMVYFSHTIKAQKDNMEALDNILAKNIRLIDYEKITDEKNNRLIAFGKYAGIAGALDFFKGFGEYIMMKGISTPFLHCHAAYKYFSIEESYKHLKRIGDQIREKNIPKELSPMIFAVTGRGRTAKGCYEVIENFPVTHIKFDQVQKIWADRENPEHQKTIYVVNVNTEDCIIPLDPNAKFDKKDFYQNPQKYTCNFGEKILPYITALFHCIFWDPGFPVYVTNQRLRELASTNRLRMLGICDITCDLEGSIECLTEFTQPEQPIFFYNPLEDKRTFDSTYQDNKFLYLAIDFLPCELAFDAACHFSSKLKDWVQNLVKSDKTKEIDDQGLIPELKRAVITYNKKLAPNFEYIARLREENEQKSVNTQMRTQKKQAIGLEYDKSQSVYTQNVKVVEGIEGETLDFSK